MTREFLRAKVHRIAVTECCVEYEGSLTLDKTLMDACDMRNFEKVLVSRGDRVIIASYCGLTEEEIEGHEPRIVLIGEGNRVKETKNVERHGVTI
jgi:aspartate 1-decarboxylase